MKVLYLTIKKKWFDMIASGEKKEEYRDITPHYFARLVDRYETNLRRNFSDYVYENFDAVTFINGYQPKSPRLTVKFLGISRSEGKTEWGAEPGKKYFVIKLGERI